MCESPKLTFNIVYTQQLFGTTEKLCVNQIELIGSLEGLEGDFYNSNFSGGWNFTVSMRIASDTSRCTSILSLKNDFKTQKRANHISRATSLGQILKQSSEDPIMKSH